MKWTLLLLLISVPVWAETKEKAKDKLYLSDRHVSKEFLSLTATCTTTLGVHHKNFKNQCVQVVSFEVEPERQEFKFEIKKIKIKFKNTVYHCSVTSQSLEITDACNSL